MNELEIFIAMNFDVFNFIKYTTKAGLGICGGDRIVLGVFFKDNHLLTQIRNESLRENSGFKIVAVSTCYDLNKLIYALEVESIEQYFPNISALLIAAKSRERPNTLHFFDYTTRIESLFGVKVSKDEILQVLKFETEKPEEIP